MEPLALTPTILLKRWRKPRQRLKVSTRTWSVSTKNDKTGLIEEIQFVNCTNFALYRRDIPRLLSKDLVTNNNVLSTSINLLYFRYRWKVLEINMEQQGLTEEEVCVNCISCREFSTQLSVLSLLKKHYLAMTCWFKLYLFGDFLFQAIKLLLNVCGISDVNLAWRCSARILLNGFVSCRLAIDVITQ